MLTYTKLWILLDKKGLKRTDLKEIMSSATLAKLGKNEPISSTVIEKICDFLSCQPGDIMENVTKEDIEKVGNAMNDMVLELMQTLTVATGMSKEALFDEMMKEAPTLRDKILNGEKDVFGIEEALKNIEK